MDSTKINANNNAHATKSKTSGDLKGLTKTTSGNIKSNNTTPTKIWNRPLKTVTQQTTRPKYMDIKAAKGSTQTAPTLSSTMKAASRVIPARTTDDKNPIANKAKPLSNPALVTGRPPTGRSITLETKRNFVKDNVRNVVASSAAPPHNTSKIQEKRVWNRYQPRAIESSTTRDSIKGNSDTENDKDVPKSSLLSVDLSIQTNEAEILNHDLLIGDIKFLLPSMDLVQTIERNRNEKRIKQLLKAERKFEPHSLHESQRLSDLKEFLERAAITKKPRQRRAIELLENDRKVIASMDEMLARALPKTESITNIKQRIKRKENELLSLFDALDKFKV